MYFYIAAEYAPKCIWSGKSWSLIASNQNCLFTILMGQLVCVGFLYKHLEIVPNKPISKPKSWSIRRRTHGSFQEFCCGIFETEFWYSYLTACGVAIRHYSTVWFYMVLKLVELYQPVRYVAYAMQTLNLLYNISRLACVSDLK